MSEDRMPGAAPTLEELRRTSDEELVRLFDAYGASRPPAFDFFLDEIRAREAAKQTRTMRNLTWTIMVLTAVVTVATLANLWVLLQR